MPGGSLQNAWDATMEIPEVSTFARENTLLEGTDQSAISFLG